MDGTPKRRKFSRCETPVVGETMKKRQLEQKSQISLKRASVNILVTCVLCLELLSGYLLSFCSTAWMKQVIWYSEWGLLVCLALSTVMDMYHYLVPFFSTAPVLLTEKQRKLLAVNKNDASFKTSDRIQSTSPPPRIEHLSSSSSSSLGTFTPPSSDQSTGTVIISKQPTPTTPRTPKSSVFGTDSYMGQTIGWGTPPRQIGSPLGNRRSTPSFYNDVSQKTSGGIGRLHPSSTPSKTVADISCNSVSETSLLGSPYSPTTFSPMRDYTPDHSLSFINQSTSSPSLSPRKSVDTPDNMITDISSLEKYLKSCDIDNQFRIHGSPDKLSSTNGHNAWSLYSRQTDYNLPLSSYRLATRSPQSALSMDEEEYGHYSSQAEELWLRLGVGRGDLDVWTENCRKWLCQTVMSRLVDQINKINQELAKTGLTEFQIGSASISTLRQVAMRKADQIPQLQAVIPYMELSQNQEYLFQRIRELSKGGCLAVYKWNSGGQFRGRPWDQDLPTDAEIVIHMLCTYMDSRLPADPKYPDGRSFTGQHFVRSPSSDKKETQKTGLILHQQHIHPPHFKVVKDGNAYDVGKGRNNLFHSIVMFLFFIKTEHFGMLGRVSLGLSGVNILCILDKK